MSAFAQKIILTVLAVGIYALCAWPPMAVVAEVLKVLAGLIVGAVWITKPGDGALVEAGKQAMRRSVPPVAIVLAVLLLGGCAGTPDQAAQNRIDANALRDQVNEASDTLEQAFGALPFICAYVGPDSAACAALEDTYRVLASAVDTTHRGIDLLDAVGVGAEQTRAAAERVLAEAKLFGAAVARSGEEVANAIEADRRDRGPGGAVPERPAPEAAPAEDAGQAPAAAP